MPSNHTPQGCPTPRKPSLFKGAACTGTVYLAGCTPLPKDDWKSDEDILNAWMGFDRDSELVPCHLLDGGKGEIEENGGEGEGEEERSPGKFLK